MAKKKEKVDYAHMNADELNARLGEAREKVFQLKFQNATAPLKNPREIASAKRDAARCLTYLKQLELKKAKA